MQKKNYSWTSYSDYIPFLKKNYDYIVIDTCYCNSMETGTRKNYSLMYTKNA